MSRSETTTSPDIGLSPAEIKSIFPKLARRPSYRARALRRDVLTLAAGELELLEMKRRKIEAQVMSLAAWLERERVR